MYKEVNKFSSNVPSHAVTFRSSNNITHQPQIGNQSWHINKVSREKIYIYTSGQGSHNHGLGFLVSPLNQNNSQSELPKTILKYIISSH